jgi:hypothetical protein
MIDDFMRLTLAIYSDRARKMFEFHSSHQAFFHSDGGLCSLYFEVKVIL